MRRNIRDVMDEKNLDASTLAAQRQESERLARVQEQQRIIREVYNIMLKCLANFLSNTCSSLSSALALIDILRQVLSNYE